MPEANLIKRAIAKLADAFETLDRAFNPDPVAENSQRITSLERRLAELERIVLPNNRN